MAGKKEKWEKGEYERVKEELRVFWCMCVRDSRRVCKETGKERLEEKKSVCLETMRARSLFNFSFSWEQAVQLRENENKKKEKKSL